MPTTLEPTQPLTQRELIHRVNNFLNLVTVSGQSALDERVAYDPERALEMILEGAGELTLFLREARGGGRY
jgi:hypothetical protein